jgi:hypothetical protein
MKIVKRDYQAKTQNKIDNRMNKHIGKTKLRHTDEIIKINQERQRKTEREHLRADHVGPYVNQLQKRKYLMLGVLCFVVMLLSMFAMLSRRAESEAVQEA